MRRRGLWWLVCLTMCLGTACDKNGKESTPTEATAEAHAEGEEGAQPGAASDDDEAAAMPEAPTDQAVAADGEIDPLLLKPAEATEQAPDEFTVEFETTEGPFQVKFVRAWAPHGVDRVYNLVKLGFFEDIAFFRAIEGFMVQFGIHGNPEVAKAWIDANFPDDPVEQKNERGYVTFAKRNAPDSRSTQLFINYRDNSKLDAMGFAPVGKVVDGGMEIVDKLFKGYGEGAPMGKGPSQEVLNKEGNAYLKAEFPELDYIQSAEIVSSTAEDGPKK